MIKKTLNVTVTYENFRGVVGSNHFYFWKNWTPSATYSGFSYSIGQFPQPVEGNEFAQPMIIATGSVNSESPKLFSKIATFSTFFEMANEPDPKFPLIITIQGVSNQQPYNIISRDSLNIQKYFSQIITLRPLQVKAADVNCSGTLNTLDSLQFSNKFLEIIESFNMGDWVLLPITFSLSELVESPKDSYSLKIEICTTGHLS